DLHEAMPVLHPGPLAAYAGGTDKRLVLAFDLTGTPAASYRLHVRLYASQGPVPELAVDVNGRRGMYFPHIQRTDRTDVVGVSPIAGWADVEVPIDGRWLWATGNRISITTT